jgi:hypothetical protein
VTRTFLPLAALLTSVLFGGCGGPGASAYLRVPAAQVPTERTRVARDVGALLGTDAEASAAAERALLARTGAERDMIAEHATTIPAERDPRWLLVLDEQGLAEQGHVPSLPPAERVAYLLWKAERPEAFYGAKARTALTDQARSDPAPLLAALEAGVAGAEHAAVALALAGRTAAVPTLLDRYVVSEDEDERRSLAEALRTLLGEGTRLRVTAPREERARRAAELKARFLLGGEAARG